MYLPNVFLCNFEDILRGCYDHLRVTVCDDVLPVLLELRLVHRNNLRREGREWGEGRDEDGGEKRREVRKKGWKGGGKNGGRDGIRMEGKGWVEEIGIIGGNMIRKDIVAVTTKRQNLSFFQKRF